MTALFTTMLTDFSPVLPDARLLRWVAPFCWGVVLAFLWLQVSGRLGQRTRLGVSAVVMVWAGLPGMWSPAYWLGLAFQMPSWMTVLLCGAYLFHALRRPSTGALQLDANPASWHLSMPSLGVATLGIAVGWLLLLDTFVLLPVYAYRWGFGFGALAVAVGLALVFCVAQGFLDRGDSPSVYPVYLLVGALALFVLTRLPTGNLFDALIDPWLWLWLQISLVRRVIRRRPSPRVTTIRG